MIMNADEFNRKYEDYLEEGHYGLDIHNEKVISFLDGVFQDLIKIPGFKYSQIKLKFGSCRFYCDEVGRLIYLIEEKINQIIKNKEDDRGTLLDHPNVINM